MSLIDQLIEAITQDDSRRLAQLCAHYLANYTPIQDENILKHASKAEIGIFYICVKTFNTFTTVQMLRITCKHGKKSNARWLMQQMTPEEIGQVDPTPYRRKMRKLLSKAHEITTLGDYIPNDDQCPACEELVQEVQQLRGRVETLLGHIGIRHDRTREIIISEGV